MPRMLLLSTSAGSGMSVTALCTSLLCPPEDTQLMFMFYFFILTQPFLPRMFTCFWFFFSLFPFERDLALTRAWCSISGLEPAEFLCLQKLRFNDEPNDGKVHISIGYAIFLLYQKQYNAATSISELSYSTIITLHSIINLNILCLLQIMISAVLCLFSWE